MENGDSYGISTKQLKEICISEKEITGRGEI
jgi:hypothetical protein